MGLINDFYLDYNINTNHAYKNVNEFYKKNKDLIFNIFCVIVFPLGLALAASHVTKKIIHVQAARFFIPAFNASTEQRAASVAMIASIIQEKGKKYIFEKTKTPCGQNIILDGMKITPKNCQYTKRLVVFSHGNKGTLSLLLQHPMLYAIMDKLQTAVFVTDYQGVGQSTFKAPTLNGLLRNSKATLDYAIKHFKPNELIIWGFSFGGAIVTSLNYQVPKTEYAAHIKSMTVADRTFSSLKEVVQAKTNSHLQSQLSQSIDWKLEPAATARNSHNDLLVLYHELDKTIPQKASLGEALKQNTPPNVTLHELKGTLSQPTNAGLKPHNDLHKRSFRPEELRFVTSHINKTLSKQKVNHYKK